MPALKILHVLDHSIPMHSGYTFRTRSILLAQRRRGWETVHCTTPRHTADGPEREDVEGLVFHRTHRPPSSLARLPVVREAAEMRATARRLAEIVQRERPHILHAHSPVLTAIPCLRVGRRFGLPVVYEIRAFWEDAAVDHGTTTEGSARFRAIRAAETWCAGRVDALTTICEGLCRDLVGRGIPEGKITVIPNAVDAEAFPIIGARDAALERDLALDGAFVLGFIGSFYAYEGLDLLVPALARLRETIPGVRLLLVGGGREEAKLRALAAEHGVADIVLFVGRVPHTDVARYYSLVDVLVYPRHAMRLTELVTPLKPLEAMAQGKVVVASDVGGHRELIRDGDTGYLFRSNDAAALVAGIERAWRSRADWPAQIVRARRFVETERTWANSVARYVDVYRPLVAGTGDVTV